MSINDYKVKAQDGNVVERFEPTQGTKIVREKIQEVIG